MDLNKSHVYAGLVAALALTAPTAASAADPIGLYLGGTVGWSLPGDSDLDGGGVDRSADLDSGPAAGIQLGYHWGGGFKTELEAAMRLHSVDDINGVNATGDMDAYALMVNLIYEADIGMPTLRPFIGGGIGYGYASAGGISPVAGSRIGDTDWSWAWQGIAGLAFDVAPNWTAQFRYSYFSMPSLDFTTDNNVGIDSDFSSHSMMMGITYKFYAPPPPPPPVAQPAPPPPPPPVAQPAPAPAPRQFIVFFDWDSARLTDQARNIIRQAAEAARRDGYARIDLTGHADRSGADNYNVRLSQRRADAVKAELQRLGINAGEITTTARGEAQPLVQTADGVREPQNRRVEIVIAGRR